MMNFTCLTSKNVYRCRVLVSLVFFYLSKNKVINYKFSFYYLSFSNLFHNYHVVVITITLQLFIKHYTITAVSVFKKKLFFCSYPDMFTEKSCSMCPDKRISTVLELQFLFYFD